MGQVTLAERKTAAETKRLFHDLNLLVSLRRRISGIKSRGVSFPHLQLISVDIEAVRTLVR